MQLKSVLRQTFWGLAVIWTLLLATAYVWRMWRLPGRPGPGLGPSFVAPSDLPRLADTVVNAVGLGSVGLFARDSSTVLLLATADCGACRSALPLLSEAYRLTRESGAAARLLVGSAVGPAEQFGRLVSPGIAVISDSGLRLIQRLGARSVPALMVYDPGRGVLARWSGIRPGLQDSMPYLRDRLVRSKREAT